MPRPCRMMASLPAAEVLMLLFHVLLAILLLAWASWLVGVLAIALVAGVRWLAGRVAVACYHGPRTPIEHKGIA